MLSYYVQGKEIGLGKWYSYSYWSSYQQWYYFKKYWIGYHNVCNKRYWDIKWNWLVRYKKIEEQRMSEKWMSCINNWEWKLKSENRDWWLKWWYLTGITVRLGSESRKKGVVLGSGVEKITLLKSPHGDKKSREQFEKRKWRLLWSLSYVLPQWEMGYVGYKGKEDN
jgi:hypothetical protein